jgi:hypothetical protein
MEKQKGLVIVHIDGLGYEYLLKALDQGRMPFVTGLLEKEGYEILRYRSGLPSTTPFVQAGILYGNNSDIPSFRWWDKQSGLYVSFGGRSTFNRVAHKYFHNCEPLTAGGAAIATCYPASAAAAYRLAYRERGRSVSQDVSQETFTYRQVITNWALNPINLLDWVRRGLWQIWKASYEYWRARLSGRPAAKKYVISNLLEEILLHQLTRFAVVAAMEAKYPVIYGAFYAYDGTAHAFGPQYDYSLRVLRHVDNTIRRIAQRRRHDGPGTRDYELVILSDHGQIDTVPFEQKYGHRLADLLAGWLPTYEIEEFKGKKVTPSQAIDGHIVLTYSGGLGHFYFRDLCWRLQYDEVEERFPGLVKQVAMTPGIGLVLMRDGANDLLITKEEQIRIKPSRGLPRAARDLLGRFDEPEIAAQELSKLNSFDRSGDLIIFGDYEDHHQINFETQVGGHGSLGGEQQFPFIMAKREWKFDTSDVTCASDLYPMLRRLRDRLLK